MVIVSLSRRAVTSPERRAVTEIAVIVVVVVVQSLSRVRLFVTPWTAARLASLSFTISRSLLKLMFIGLVMLSKH